MSGARIRLDTRGTFVKDPEYTLFSSDGVPREEYIAGTFEIPFDSPTHFGEKASVLIPPKGDIIRRIYIRSKLPALYTPLGPGYVYPLYTDQVDGSIYVQTSTLAIQPGDFVGYFNTQFLNAWATNFVGTSNLSVSYDSNQNKFVFTSSVYANIFFQNEQSASFWGFDIRTPDLTVSGYPAFNFTSGTLTAPLTLVQAGWIRGFTPPPSTGFSYVDSVACRLIKEATLTIGGQTIDRLTSERLIIEDDLGVPYENQAALTILEGKNDSSAISAQREYYTRLSFNTDMISMNALQNQDVRVNVEFEKFENLPANLITTNGLTDGASYVNTQWKALNGITTDAFLGRVISMVFWKKYIIYVVGDGNPFTKFWFYDTTKPPNVTSSWNSWQSDLFNVSVSAGRPMTVGSYLYYSTNFYLVRVFIPDMLAGTAISQYGPVYLENKYISFRVQVGVSGGISGICADARYIYILYTANMVSFGSNSAALYDSNWFTTDSNAYATFNVYSISTTQLITAESDAVKSYMNLYAPSAPGGVTKNPATIISQVKIGSNLQVTSNVTYTYTSNGQPALQTFGRLFNNGTSIWLRYDTTKSILSLSSYDYLSWPGTGAPISWFDITNQPRLSIDSFYPASDGRYIYTSNPYFFKVDTQNFLTLTSYTYKNTSTLSPVPNLSSNFNVPNATDGRYIYFRSTGVSSGSVTFMRYDSTRDISLQSSYSTYTYSSLGTALPNGYELTPIGFDGKSIYYVGGTFYISGTFSGVALSIIRVDSATFTVTGWIVFNGSGNAKTSNGPVSNTITLTSETIVGSGNPSVAVPVMAVGSRYIYVGEQWGGGFETFTDFIQFDPLTMSGTNFPSSALVKYETYSNTPPTNQISLYGQTDLNEFTIRQGRVTETFELQFVNPVRELWIVVENPGVLSRFVLRLNNEILVDDDQVTSRYLRTFETHTTMPTSSNVNVYSFSFDPEKLHPSGTLNMSRIAYPSIDVTLTSAAPSDLYLRVYSKSFNVLGYQGGLGGLLFNSAL